MTTIIHVFAERFFRLVWQTTIIFLGPVLFCLLAYDQQRFVEELPSSEALLPAAFVYDLMHFRDVWEWFQLPRVQSLFPDLAIYWIVQEIGGNWRVAHFAYGLFSLLGITALAAIIISKIAKCEVWRGALSFQIVVLPILLFELYLTERVYLVERPEASLHFLLFHPVTHSGPFILSLCATILVWLMIERGGITRMPWLVTLISVAGVISDKLFFLEFLGPIMATSFILTRTKVMRWRDVRNLTGVCAVSIAASFLVDQTILHQAYLQPEWQAFPRHVLNFLRSPFVELAASAPWATLFCYALPLMAACIVMMILLSGRQIDEVMWSRNAMVFYSLMALSSILVTAGGTALVYENVYSYRYIQTLLWWPLILVGAGVASRLTQWQMKFSAAALGAISCLMAFAYLVHGFHQPKMLTWREPLAACLLDLKKSNGLRAGLSEFWLANYLSAMTDFELQVQPISRSGAAIYWGSDSRWFTHDIHDPARQPDFNFILMTHPQRSRADANYLGLSELQIADLYGKPNKILQCPTFSRHGAEMWSSPADVWLYNESEKNLKALVSNSLDLKLINLAHGLDVCVAPRLLFGGKLLDDGVREVQHNSPNGAAFWGPYMDLPHGNWNISLVYRLIAPTEQGHIWSITADNNREELFKATLPPTGEQFATARATLDLRKAKNVAFLLKLGGPGTLTVKNICISSHTQGGQN